MEQIIAKANDLDDDLKPIREKLKKMRQEAMAEELAQAEKDPKKSLPVCSG